MKKMIIGFVLVLCVGIITAYPTFSLYFGNVNCNIDGSASSTSVECSGQNEDGTDATYDSCVDGTNDNYMHVENVYVKKVPGKRPIVDVTCEICPYSSGTEYAIWYKGEGNWENKAFGNTVSGSGLANCPLSALENVTKRVQLDQNTNTHYFRCWTSWTGCNSNNECCSSTYADNDDVKYITPYVEVKKNILNQR